MTTRIVPQNIAELEEFAVEVLENLIKRYNVNRFFNDLSRENTGLIFRCAGSVSILLLVNTFKKCAQRTNWQDIVLEEFEKVQTHVRDKGYDASPLVPPTLTAKLFSPTPNQQHYDYLDSVSWVLSFALLLRLTQRQKRIVLDLEKQQPDVLNTIKKTLTIITGSACPKGGWGFVRECSQADLYYTYAVSEALADYGDYVMGESEEEIDIDADEELKKFLTKDLTDKVEAARKKTAGWLVENYLEILGKEMVNPNPSKNKAEDDEEHEDHILLYPTYFVIDTLITCSADTEFKEKNVLKKLEHAIYVSRIAFDRAYEDKAWWDNPKASSFKLEWAKHPKLAERIKGLGIETPDEPGLVGLSLRCNSLYAFYIAKGWDKKMGELFQIVYDNRDTAGDEATGLWDASKFDLMVTERSIEALVDYADYLAEYQEELGTSGKVSTADRAYREAITLAVRECLGSPDGNGLAAGLDVTKEVSLAVREYLQSGEGKALIANNLVGVVSAPTQPFTEEDLADKMQSIFRQCSGKLHDQKGGRLKDRSNYALLNEAFHLFLVALLADRICSAVGKEEGSRKDLTEDLKNREREILAAFGRWLDSKPAAGLGVMFNYVREKAGSDYQQSAKP